MAELVTFAQALRKVNAAAKARQSVELTADEALAVVNQVRLLAGPAKSKETP